MNDSITLGIISIKLYSIIICIALFIGILLINNEAKKHKINQDFITNLMFWTVIVSIIGARIYYVVFEWGYYSKNLIDIFKIWEGGLAIHGAIIAGALFIILYTYKYKTNTLKMFDIIVPALCLGQAIGRWGNFFNQEAHGPSTTLSFLQSIKVPQFIIDGMYINGTYYHPTFFYESVWTFMGFIILIILRHFKRLKIGTLTGVYLMWYSIGRFLIESLRTDSLMLGNFKMAQIISIILFVVGLLILILCNRGSKLDNLYSDIREDNIKF